MLTRRHPQPRQRRGFSLIEILVVISIIGVLAAISAGAMFRLRAAQVTSNTEGTLSKLHGLMMSHWNAVVDQAARTVPVALVDRCNGDKERAKALWTFGTLKNEFPMTFAEAKATVGVGAGVSIPPRKVFVNVANGPALANFEEESAALFHAILNQTGNAGSAAGSDGSNQQVATTSAGATVYKDGWGGYVVFVRQATGGEINEPPYSRGTMITVTVQVSPGVTAQKQLKVVNMLDPRALMSDWGAVGQNAWLDLTTMDGSQKNSLYLKQEFERGLTAAGLPTRMQFRTIKSGENAIPTLVSSGANKKPGGDYFDVVNDDSADNLLSYRLRREGDKGN